MWINPKTGKGWTDEQEATFATIMRVGHLTRIKAIQLFRRCRSNHAKALKLAQENYGLSDVRAATYESTRTARLAGLAKARQAAAQNRQIQLPEVSA
jgi:hypothetical protein